MRDNMAKLEDESMFYRADPKNPTQVLTVQFLELWVSWANVFSKKYDIPNTEVVKALKAGRLGQPALLTEINTASDVNLGA